VWVWIGAGRDSEHHSITELELNDSLDHQQMWVIFSSNLIKNINLIETETLYGKTCENTGKRNQRKMKNKTKNCDDDAARQYKSQKYTEQKKNPDKIKTEKRWLHDRSKQ
jgi:hypothetical protein